MRDRDLGLLIVFSDNFHIGNCRYLTGIKPNQSFSPSWESGNGAEVVTLPLKGDPILWVPSIFVGWVKKRLASIGLGDESWMSVKPWVELNDGLKELSGRAKSFAYEGRRITPWPIYEGIRKAIGYDLQETDILEHQRRIKGQKEIKLLEVASRINDQICVNLVSGAIKYGVTEKEVCHKICKLAYSMGAETCDANFMIDEDLGWAHPTDNTVEDGRLLSLHVILSYEGYYSDNDRVIGFGNISKEDEELAHACKLALEAGLKAMKPGIIGKQAMEAAWSAHKWANHSKWSMHIGHAIGIEGEELGGWGDWTLEKDMVLCFSPGAFHNGKTWATEDVVHITESGPRLLTKFPVDYIIRH
jgi:Xaa-Pro aminopeptidase